MDERTSLGSQPCPLCVAQLVGAVAAAVAPLLSRVHGLHRCPRWGEANHGRAQSPLLVLGRGLPWPTPAAAPAREWRAFWGLPIGPLPHGPVRLPRVVVHADEHRAAQPPHPESSYSGAAVLIALSFRPADAARATEGLVTVSVDLFGDARPRSAELVPRARPSPRLPIEIARASATHSIGRPLSGILGANISAWRQMNVARRREVDVIAAMRCGHVASSASVLGGWALDIVTADVLARIKECIDRFELCVDEQGASHASGAELARVVSPNARVVDRY
ncbi:hypothetical protein MSAN_02362700 [Mycena sanguinolenta]|uniref:Uncharacterized protein n=1 Tax=Mycena sanguinolenta TaxID=230812 RepID=A0A8H6X6G7_9AGAR|nr:hypothetical protein MSAN_02362700 [Mycena sanguinolenta]